MSFFKVERSEKPEDWIEPIKRVIWQLSYRVLGQVSLYCPIDVAVGAIDTLSKLGMGEWKWLIKDRVIIWFDIPINHAMKMHAYVYGSKLRRKNTVFTRVGWWRMYFIESLLTRINKVFVRE